MSTPEIVYDLYPDTPTLQRIFGDWLPERSTAFQDALYNLKKGSGHFTLAAKDKKWAIEGKDRAIYLLDVNGRPTTIYCFLPLNKPRFESFCPHQHPVAVFQGVVLEDLALKFGLKILDTWDDLDYMQIVRFIIPETGIEVVIQWYDGQPKNSLDLYVTTAQFDAPYLPCIIVSVYEVIKSLGGSLIWTHDKCDMLVCEMLGTPEIPTL